MSIALPQLTLVGNIRGKKVFLRVDLNVPIQGGLAVDAYRIERSKKTLEFLRDSGARILLVSHRTDEQASLFPVFEYLKTLFPIAFAKTIEEARIALQKTQNGAFVLLENIRKLAGEKEKVNDRAFAKELSSLADIYVNEAFSVSHREHASIVGVPKFLPSYAGFRFEEEVENLSQAFSPAHPALVILGGAKFETKAPLIKRFLGSMDEVYVCGALANDIYKARGYETGVSLVSEIAVDSEILENPKLHVPSQIIARAVSGSQEKNADAVKKGEKIVDAGSAAFSDIRARIKKSRFVLWNGPLGEYESGYDAGTVAVAQAIAESKAKSIIGGGDSLAVVSNLGLLERFSFVSTGGGAMLEFLANGTLPGIKALQKSL